MINGSENIRAQKEINTSEIRYRRLFEAAQDGIFILDAGTGSILDVNPFLIKMLEYTKEDFIGKKLWEIGPFKDIVKSKISFYELQDKEYIRYDNLPLETKNGKLRECEFISNVYDECDRKVIQCNIRDNSERKSAEELRLKLHLQQQEAFDQQTRQNETKYRNLFNNHPDYCYAISNEGKIMDVNYSALDALGYKKEELIGNTLQMIYAPESIAGRGENYEKWSATGKLNNVEMILITKAGRKRTVLLTATAIRDDNGGILHSIYAQRDITEQKKLEEQILQSQKMDAIGTLTGGIAHDFNNLLTVILGNANIVMDEIDKTSQIYRDIMEIHIAAARAASLTRQLLLYSRKQPMGFSPINVNKAINDLLRMLERLLGEDIMIKLEMDPDILTVSADLSNLEQVIINLCINSRDAMPGGGIITIKTENVIMSEDQVNTIEGSKPGNFVRLSISDTGAGMDKKTIKQIFEPFFTTKGLGKGTGLGLSVVYGILKAHNGWINVYSEPALGTVFKIYLPAEKSKAAVNNEENAEAAPTLKGKGEHILIIEDEEKVLAYIEKILTKNNYYVHKAANSKNAIEVFKENSKSIGLVITDMILSDKNGLDTLEQLKLVKNNIGAIVCSGYLDDKSHFSEIREKGYSFIQKPFEINKLLKTIREILEKKK